MSARLLPKQGEALRAFQEEPLPAVSGFLTVTGNRTPIPGLISGPEFSSLPGVGRLREVHLPPTTQFDPWRGCCFWP